MARSINLRNSKLPFFQAKIENFKNDFHEALGQFTMDVKSISMNSPYVTRKMFLLKCLITSMM